MKYFILGLTIFFGTTNSQGQQSKIDSLKKALFISKEDTSKVNIYDELIWSLIFDNPDTVKTLCENALRLAVKLNFQKGIGKLENKLGVYYEMKNLYPMALSHFYKALSIWDKLENQNGNKNFALNQKAKTISNIANIYKEQEDYSKALSYYFQALEIDKKLERKYGIAASLLSIGQVYYLEGYSSDSSMVQKQAYYSISLDYLSKALNIAEAIKDKGLKSIILSSLSSLYSINEDHDKAIDNEFKSLKLCEETGDKGGIASSLGNIGIIYFKTKKYKLSESYLNKSLELNKELKSLTGIRINEKWLAKIDSAMGNFKGAFEHYKRHIVAHREMANEEIVKNQTKLELQFEYSKKEILLKAEQEKQQAVAEEKNRKQKIIIWSVVLGLILVIAFAGFIFKSLNTTRKQKLLIEIKNMETEEQKKVIEEKQKDILDSIRYARRIQTSLLPTEKYIDKILGNNKTQT